MARIRTIKPEFWTDEKVVELSTDARLLFIGLWNFADEHGNLDGSEKRIKMQIFPADSIDVEDCLIEILRVGFLSDYYIEGKRYFHINNFHKHQKVNQSSPNKFPPPPDKTVADSSDKNALEKEKEKEKDSAKADSDKNPSYAFVGETIKLNQRDFDKISRTYSRLDILTELTQLDIELRGKKSYWEPMHAKLRYRNEKQPEPEANLDRLYR